MNAKTFLPAFLVVACGAFKLGDKARMNSAVVVWAAGLLTVAFASRCLSAPLPINILNTQYTNSVSVSSFIPLGGGVFGYDYTNYSRTTLSSVPVSDSLYHPVSGQLEAEANAGLFSISASTAADGHDVFRANSTASAQSKVWFSPLISELSTINIQFSGWEQWYY